jgi:hypothetical protein
MQAFFANFASGVASKMYQKKLQGQRARPLSQILRICQLSQRESLWRNHELCSLTGNFSAMPRPLPLGEVAVSEAN